MEATLQVWRRPDAILIVCAARRKDPPNGDDVLIAGDLHAIRVRGMIGWGTVVELDGWVKLVAGVRLVVRGMGAV